MSQLAGSPDEPSSINAQKAFLYAPAFPREAWAAGESLSLIDRLFGGRLAPLVAQFASERKLGADDLAALKALLKDQDRG